MTPYFSLILPCYNVEKYLERCVRSILSQNFEDYEIILVDDGAKDGTPALCDAFAEVYDRIQVIHKENGGLSSARNAGLDAARGLYVWFIDSDDWIENGALKLLHQVCVEDELDVVKFDRYRVDDSVQAIRSAAEPGIYAGERLDLLWRKAFCSAGRYGLSAWGHIYRRAMLQEHHLHFVSEREVGSEDYLFNFQVMIHAKVIRVLDIPLYYYERRAGSLTQTYKADLAKRYVQLRDRLVAYYTECGKVDRYGAFVERFFLWHLIIGTCVTHEYDTQLSLRSTKDARKGVRRLLNMKETQQAARRADSSSLDWKKRVLLIALQLRIEPVFYYVYAKKD